MILLLGVVCFILRTSGLGCCHYFGCHFGYHVNAAKTWLVVKQKCLASA